MKDKKSSRKYHVLIKHLFLSLLTIIKSCFNKKKALLLYKKIIYKEEVKQFSLTGKKSPNDLSQDTRTISDDDPLREHYPPCRRYHYHHDHLHPHHHDHPHQTVENGRDEKSPWPT